MSGARQRQGVRGWATAALVLMPVLVAALAAVGTAAVPASLVHGDLETGPKGLASVHPAPLDYRPTLRWGPGRTSVILTAHPRGACRVHLGRISSTAPGRVEVDVKETGAPCTGRPGAPQDFRLPLPLIAEPRGSVQVQLGRISLFIHRGSPTAPHPQDAHDWY